MMQSQDLGFVIALALADTLRGKRSYVLGTGFKPLKPPEAKAWGYTIKTCLPRLKALIFPSPRRWA